MSICNEYYNSEWKGNDLNIWPRYSPSLFNYTQIGLDCCYESIRQSQIQSEMDAYKSRIQSRHESPMPWIGMYVAAASLVCSLAMAADVWQGFRHRKLWFPCRFFTLNAASLTLLAVATKLTVDLTTEMPTYMEHLAKLTSLTFMPTAIGNFMPSLGSMDNKQIFMNITALAILVITISVNICIQFTTLVIYPFFFIEHIAALVFMLAFLLISIFLALVVPTTKKSLQVKYDEIHQKNMSQESGNFTTENLKLDLKKYWMMARSANPQFVVARSVTCCASGGFGFLALLVLAEAHIKISAEAHMRGFLNKYDNYISFDSLYVNSNYKWSTRVILVIQSFGVVVGSIAPIFRWFVVARFTPLDVRALKAENYWIERLVGWKESPLGLQIRSQKWTKIFYIAKNFFLDCCIGLQIAIVVASKLVMIISSIAIRPLFSLGHLYKVLKEKLTSQRTASSNRLGPYVLNLEGEGDLPFKIFMKKDMDATDRFIKEGAKQRPKYLEELLGKSNAFEGVAMFDSDQVPPLYSKEPPNCWSLPVVTLTSLAISLPNIEKYKVKWLLQSVSEGLVYANLVEELLNAKSDMANVINAASTVWSSVYLFPKWLDEDLRKIAQNSAETLLKLADKADKKVNEFKAKAGGDPEKNTSEWPVKGIAANSMYRISRTVLQIHEGSDDRTDQKLFEQLCIMIADIFSACLVNLPRVINMKCYCSCIEEREESVQHAAQLLGKTEEILKNLPQDKVPPILNPDKVAYIDEWRALFKQERPLDVMPVINDDTSASNSGNSASSSNSENGASSSNLEN